MVVVTQRMCLAHAVGGRGGGGISAEIIRLIRSMRVPAPAPRVPALSCVFGTDAAEGRLKDG